MGVRLPAGTVGSSAREGMGMQGQSVSQMMLTWKKICSHIMGHTQQRKAEAKSSSSERKADSDAPW